ncbi:hypothetical protein YH65_05220 [Sulfurovum lithotrophicum]|uniref:DUF302 domain-containing protein n=1 Tax=Sulfurovum lithotrophicum TaxID=206403 RepID=A0A7U4RRL9_9BACT|nr:DUF302 domain-containing protein [Sulfurovum lithotrophicum]AKF25965.1 hypothetical protein YH65_05220 [Sulfurovum lithotrophicum]
MGKILKVFIGAFLVLGANIFAAENQNIQIFSTDNSNGSINAKSIEKAFNDSGVIVDVNNDMNSIFSKRYGKVYHKNYNLAIFTNPARVTKLMKKYPTIGLITPLSMSIYEDDKTINIATLSLAGMSRITKIPMTDPDLTAYAKSVDAALHKALPKGKYLPVNHTLKSSKPLVTVFTTEFEVEDGDTITDAKESFEEEFESELGPVGFLIPKSYKLKHDNYDFFDTYSIIRFNAIYPVYKNHPDAGAYAPFSLVIYKKKGDDTVHIAYPSIDNWITDLDITDKETVKAVKETQEKIKNILEELTE